MLDLDVISEKCFYYQNTEEQTSSSLQKSQLRQMETTAFTKEQYEQIAQLINQNKEAINEPESKNVAGINNAFLVSSKVQDWIIDTCATNYMVSDLSLLDEKSITKPTILKQVYL